MFTRKVTSHQVTSRIIIGKLVMVAMLIGSLAVLNETVSAWDCENIASQYSGMHQPATCDTIDFETSEQACTESSPSGGGTAPTCFVRDLPNPQPGAPTTGCFGTTCDVQDEEEEECTNPYTGFPMDCGECQQSYPGSCG